MAATLTEDVVIEISALSRDRAEERLLECLGWQILDSEDDLHKSIQLDFLYSILEFCVMKGFSPSETCHLFQLSYEMLNCAQWKQMTSALCIYKTKCHQLQEHVQLKNMRSFSEFFFSTFIKNYKLYQYVTEESRDRQCTQLVLPVNVPPAIPPLRDGKEAAVWNYLEKLSHIEAKERQQLLKRSAEREEMQIQDQQAINDAYSDLNQLKSTSDTQAVLEIIKRSVGAHISELSHSLQFKIQDAAEVLTYKIEKNSVPRPPQLGPPPQHAMASAKAKTINSSRSEKQEAKKTANKK